LWKTLERQGDSLNQEKELLVRARRKREEAELSVFLGKHFLASEVATALRNLCLNQRAVFVRKLEQELPARLVGRTEIEINQCMRDTVDEVLAIFYEAANRFFEGTTRIIKMKAKAPPSKQNPSPRGLPLRCASTESQNGD
jgi:hypothetical protein